MWAVKLLLFLAIAYLLVLGLVFFAQTALLFPTRMVAAAAPLAAGSTRLLFAGPGGEKLHGVHVRPTRPTPNGRTAILGFGGNAWNADAVAAFLHQLYPQADVVAFHYRGYRPSSGRPSAAALLADAPLIHDHLIEHLGASRIVAVGFSIGAGVAAHLASRRPLAGLILVTPFDSLESVASRHYRWLPAALLLRHRMSPIDDLSRSMVPTALIIAGRDTLIPPVHGEALARAVPNLVLARTILDAGHNDIYQHPYFGRTMAESLERIDANRAIK